jgi:hypothetical protein
MVTFKGLLHLAYKMGIDEFRKMDLGGQHQKYIDIQKKIDNSVNLPLLIPHVHYESEIYRRETGFLWWAKREPVQIDRVRFSGGCTRTTWLIRHGCEVFPVRCAPSEASRLQELAGAAAFPLLTASMLLELSKSEPYGSDSCYN